MFGMLGVIGWVLLMAVFGLLLVVYIWIGNRRGYEGKVMGLYLLMTWGFTWFLIRFCKQVVDRYFLPEIPPRDLANYILTLNERFVIIALASFLIIYVVYLGLILKQKAKKDPLEDKLDDIGKG